MQFFSGLRRALGVMTKEMRQSILQLLLLTFVLGIIAPACGMMWGGKLSVIEICTTEGIQIIALADENTPTVPPKLKPDHCSYCFASTYLAMDISMERTIKHPLFAQIRMRHLIADQITQKFIKIAAPARGPPILS